MKKTMKMLTILLVAIMLVATLSTPVLASGSSTGSTSASSVIEDINNAAKTEKPDDSITQLGGAIVATVQVIGVVVAVVILLVIGIKYMIGSASEKAEYKKTMIPYIVGAILIFASTTIVNIVYNLANGLNQQ